MLDVHPLTLRQYSVAFIMSTSKSTTDFCKLNNSYDSYNTYNYIVA